jgi:hypothetical protein
MENKYFTPDIEDIHVGYECEILNNKEKWNKINMPSIFIPKCVNKVTERNGWLETNKLRVPYLTKEQIEAEGWELSSEDKYLQFVKPNYSISYVEKLHLLIVIALEEKQSDVKYSGTCKDINTFRKITKLLGI